MTAERIRIEEVFMVSAPPPLKEKKNKVSKILKIKNFHLNLTSNLTIETTSGEACPHLSHKSQYIKKYNSLSSLKSQNQFYNSSQHMPVDVHILLILNIPSI